MISLTIIANDKKKKINVAGYLLNRFGYATQQKMCILLAHYAWSEMTSQSLWSRYDRHFVGITQHNALS